MDIPTGKTWKEQTNVFSWITESDKEKRTGEARDKERDIKIGLRSFMTIENKAKTHNFNLFM